MGLARNVLSDFYRLKRNTNELATDFNDGAISVGVNNTDPYAEVDDQIVLEQIFIKLSERFPSGTPLGNLANAVRQMIDDGIACNDYLEITRRTGIPSCNVRVYFHRMAKAARSLVDNGGGVGGRRAV